MQNMSALDLALQYMQIFYSGKELDRLSSILHADLKFRGPLFQFDTAWEYIASIKADPPVACSYRILHTFEKENVVNLLYDFYKPGITTTMSQLFEVRNDKIIRIVLIFDSAVFAKKEWNSEIFQSWWYVYNIRFRKCGFEKLRAGKW